MAVEPAHHQLLGRSHRRRRAVAFADEADESLDQHDDARDHQECTSTRTGHGQGGSAASQPVSSQGTTPATTPGAAARTTSFRRRRQAVRMASRQASTKPRWALVSTAWGQ